MTKEERYNQTWMDVAMSVSQLSHCARRKVGCVIVKDGRPITSGFNGTPTGFDNCCEDANNNTFSYVIHAEANAFDKVASQGGVGVDGATLYVTMQPCESCAIRIVNNRISSVYYREQYRDDAGLNFLKLANIPTYQI